MIWVMINIEDRMLLWTLKPKGVAQAEKCQRKTGVKWD